MNIDKLRAQFLEKIVNGIININIDVSIKTLDIYI